MPSYGSQLLARRTPTEYAQPNLAPIYKGYDARTQRHDAAQQGYAQYVDNVVKSDTLDPVEKQRKLGELKDQVYGLYNKYDGNISDARDELMGTIVDNRKDPYWKLDETRTKSYNDLKSQEQKMRASGKIPLFRDAQGNYVNSYQDKFTSLKDAQGNYRPITDYNIQAEEQLDYEKPFNDMFSKVKANIADGGVSFGNVDDAQLAKYIAGFMQTGQVKSPNANLNRVLQNSLQDYMLTPEWKQMKGRYGEGAAQIASDLASNVAERYKYSQNQVNRKAFDVPESKSGTNAGNGLAWGRRTTTVNPMNNASNSLILNKKFTDKFGKSVTFGDKYSNLNKLLNDGLIKSEDLMSEASIQGGTQGGIAPKRESKGSVLERIGNNLDGLGMPASDKAKTIAELSDFLDENVNLAQLQKDVKNYNTETNFYRKQFPQATAGMDDNQIVDLINSNSITGKSEIVHTFPNSALTSIGGDGIFDSSKDYTMWRGKEVYYREKGSNTWEKSKGESGNIGWDDSDLFDAVSKPDANTDILLTGDKGSGYYAEGEDVEVLVKMPEPVTGYLKPLKTFEENVDKVKMLGGGQSHVTQRGLDENVVVMKSLNGPKVITFDPKIPVAEINATIQSMKDGGATTEDIINYYDDQGLVLTSDYYNKYLKNRLSPVEKVGASLLK